MIRLIVVDDDIVDIILIDPLLLIQFIVMQAGRGSDGGPRRTDLTHYY